MNQENLIRMWKIINLNDMVKNKSYDVATILDLVEETKYIPINEKYCITEVDGMSWLLTQENGQIVVIIEGGAI